MKVSQFIIALSIVCSPATAATRRRLNNTIKGDESSMSYASTLYAAKSGSGSRSKRGTMPPTGSPTGAPTSPEPGTCGSIIDTNGSDEFTLQESIACDCGDKPALLVQGRGTVLNLNGYNVECNSSKRAGDNAIVVEGFGNTIKSGSVKGFTGIILGEEGSHTVNDVEINDADLGIDVDSDNNVIDNSYISNSVNDGILIAGNNNIVRGNTIVGAGFNGIEVANGKTDNNVLRNNVFSSLQNGVLINVNVDRTIVQGNILNGNGAGIVLFTKNKNNILDANTVTNNGGGAFSCFSNGIKIVDAPLSTDDSKVTVTRNVVVGNSPGNIVVPDGTTLAGNIVTED